MADDGVEPRGPVNEGSQTSTTILEKVEFQLRLGQSKPIYNAFKTIRESSDWETLSDARKRVVEGRRS
ncbi:hypothetical protein ACSBR2_020907 [Camellia fascicularis]